MIEVKRDPSPREVRVFGGLCLIFFAALGGVVLWRPEGLLGAAMILGTAWLVSLVLNPEGRLLQLAGVLLPGLFVLAGGSVRMGAAPLVVAAVLGGVGSLAAVMIWALPGLGRGLYVGWMLAAQPIGWTISHLVLGAVYYLVLTPVGWVLRLLGRDPMQRRFDRAAKSYWVERTARPDASRHFKQF